MKLSIIFVTAFFTLIITGCSSTGGSIGGLFPAPKLLDGEINNSIYTSKDRIFSISLPHKESSNEFSYMQIKEEHEDDRVYVIFGPSARDHSTYRVEVSIFPDTLKAKPNLEEVATIRMNEYNEKLQSRYGITPDINKSEKIKINNFDAHYYNITLKAPISADHLVYIINYNVGIGIINIVIPTNPPPLMVGLSPHYFAESLKILPSKTLNSDAPR